MQISQVMTSYTRESLIKYEDILADLYQKCLFLCSKILINVLQDTSLTVLLPWQHTEFQTFPILKAFLATFGVPFSYLQMVAHLHNSVSIQNILAQICGQV